MGVVQSDFGMLGVVGSGAGPATALVFLHGVGSDKSVWKPQLDHFGATRPCFAFDYPGYGESDFLEDATRLDFAKAILAAMNSLGLERAHICGLSLGGVIAIAMHAIAPGRCASLILADTFAKHPEGQRIYDRSIDASQSLGMRKLAEARASSLLGSGAGADVLDEIIETMSRIDPAAYELGARAVWLADQRHEASAIDVPVLVLVGDEDAITPPALSKELAGLIDGSRYVEIAGSGHLANLEQPADFNYAVEQFLSGIE